MIAETKSGQSKELNVLIHEAYFRMLTEGLRSYRANTDLVVET